jgi:integrase
MRLTDLQIKKLKPPETGQKTFYDEALPGFGIRVSQGGSKSFVVMIGKSRQLKTLGRYPSMALADARRQAKRYQSDVSLLEMPQIGKPALVSFDEAKERFLKDSDRRNKASTAGEYRRLLNRHFNFEKNLCDITRQDIMSVIEHLNQTHSEPRHAFIAIRTIMNWCQRNGMIDASPVPPLKFKAQSRARVLTDGELQKVWRRAEEFEYPYGSIVQLLILTGQRRGEISGLRWDWIKDDDIVFPQGFAKNSREHRLPIGVWTKRILNELPQFSDMVFPSRYDEIKNFSGWSKAKRQFDQTIDVRDYVLHDLRRTFSSNLAQLGTPIHVAEKLLNHVSGTVSGIAAVYNRYTYLPEMRQAVAAYDAHLQKLLDL